MAPAPRHIMNTPAARAAGDDPRTAENERGAHRFRKKPVEIDAVQFTGGEEGWQALMEWLVALGLEGEDGDGSDGSSGMWLMTGAADSPLIIDTLEGEMRADPLDWIIRGVAGEFYPCKPDIFEATYEPVSES